MKAGDRVVRRRRGCVRTYGVVVDVVPMASEPGRTWARVRWDHGPVCFAFVEELKLSRKPLPQ